MFGFAPYHGRYCTVAYSSKGKKELSDSGLLTNPSPGTVSKQWTRHSCQCNANAIIAIIAIIPQVASVRQHLGEDRQTDGLGRFQLEGTLNSWRAGLHYTLPTYPRYCTLLLPNPSMDAPHGPTYLGTVQSCYSTW